MDRFWVDFGLFRDHFGIDLTSFWDRFAVILGSFWRDLELFLSHFSLFLGVSEKISPHEKISPQRKVKKFPHSVLCQRASGPLVLRPVHSVGGASAAGHCARSDRLMYRSAALADR